jgi:thiol:disulfide interchange protein
MKKIIFIGLLVYSIFSFADEVKINNEYVNFFINETIVIYKEETSVIDNYKWFIQIENKSKDAIEIIERDDTKQKEKDKFKLKFIKTGDVKFRLIYANINNRKDIKEVINYHVTIKKNPIEFKWYTDFESAKIIAKRENRNILLLFTGSDWCGACKVLERDILETEEFKNFAKENFILVKMDYLKKSEQAPEMKKQIDRLRFNYNQTIFPCTYVVDYDGKEIGIIKGAKKNYIELLKELNNK